MIVYQLLNLYDQRMNLWLLLPFNILLIAPAFGNYSKESLSPSAPQVKQEQCSEKFSNYKKRIDELISSSESQLTSILRYKDVHINQLSVCKTLYKQKAVCLENNQKDIRKLQHLIKKNIYILQKVRTANTQHLKILSAFKYSIVMSTLLGSDIPENCFPDETTSINPFS